jgi:hypothetical protein
MPNVMLELFITSDSNPERVDADASLVWWPGRAFLFKHKARKLLCQDVYRGNVFA